MTGSRAEHVPITSSSPDERTGREFVRLAEFDNRWYDPGRSAAMRAIWLFIGAPLVRSSMIPFSSIKAAILRRFGARIGRRVVIKPGVRVKYPWLLSVGDHSWIGEDAWI